MIRSAMIGALAAGMTMAFTASAATAAPTTTTTSEQGVVETFVGGFPTCEGDAPPYTVIVVSNLVFHETVFDDGRVHVTLTRAGKFAAVPLEDSGLPSYTGRLTEWGGFNENGSAGTDTVTLNLRGTGSDGSTLAINLVQHINERPDGSVNGFFHCR